MNTSSADKAGEGGMRSTTKGAAAAACGERDAFALRYAADVAEDVFVRVQPEALDEDEAAVHFLWC